MNEVRYQGVLLDDEGVTEYDHGRRMVFVPRANIQEIRHEVGWRSERPVVQAVVGGTLLAVGLYLLRLFVLAFLREGTARLPTVEVGLGAMLPIFGGWALVAAFSRGDFLRIVLLDGDSRKILLRGRQAPDEFAKFVRQAREIGYSVVER